MNKLKLEIDALAVESFDTGAEGATRRGTVEGHDDSTFPTRFGATCNAADTCVTSCKGGPLCDCVQITFGGGDPTCDAACLG